MATPNPDMKIDTDRTAMISIDSQNDFLSPEGVTWGVVGESVVGNNTLWTTTETVTAVQESRRALTTAA